MRKLSYSILTLLLSFLSVNTMASKVDYLVVDLTDGSQTVVALADQPTITSQGGELKVMVAGETKVSAALGDVKMYSFSADMPSSIKNIISESSRLEQGHVYFTKAQAGETVAVYKSNGHLVKQVRISDDGSADIDLSTLPKGLYIVKSKKSSIKVINK